MDCSAVKAKLFAYVDDELDGDLRAQVDAHLLGCANCRRLVDLELEFNETYVERLRPDPAPAHVWQRTTELLASLFSQQRAGRRTRRFRRSISWVFAVGLVGIGVAAGFGIPRLFLPVSMLHNLAKAAVEQHRKLVSGVLPADIKDTAPKGVEEWFKHRLPFNISLPEPPTNGLRLLSGRISYLLDVEVAALSYRLDGEPVSLFILPGEAYRRLGLAGERRFKVVENRGYDVIVWRSRGVGYALVSEIGGRSCFVCHSPDEKLDPLPRTSFSRGAPAFDRRS